EQMLASSLMRARITSKATGTSASMRKINKRTLSNVLIPLPAIDAQLAYSETCLLTTSAIITSRKELQALRTVRLNVLGQVLSGKTEIPPSYDAVISGVV